MTRAPADFLWGTATAAYQIEGAYNEDGKGPSIWDTFSHTPGKIERGETGDIAADHYHHWQEDIAIMADLGLKAYRLSIAWSRVLPNGRGAANPAGLGFYERLVDGLLEKNIVPFVTLYHWDLPQALQEKGGWLNRDTTDIFAEYADLMTRTLGDRVRNWITLNEPFVSANNGHVEGTHAPGLRDIMNFVPVTHHLLLAHGRALEPIRANVKDAQVGIAFSLGKIEPATGKVEDEAIVDMADAMVNRIYLDPVLRGTYPAEVASLLDDQIVRGNDLAIINGPVEMIGVNYYLRLLVRATPQNPLPGFEMVPPEAHELTEMGWEVYPEGLDYWLRRVAREYPDHDIYVTENGTAYPDVIDPNGEVHDDKRVAYLKEHISTALQTMDDGVPLKGYFVWSFMDNFEWAKGFRPRFGLVYTDYPTQRRYVKESGRWYSRLIATGSPDEA